MSLQRLSSPVSESGSNEEAWLSIGDLMSVLFLIFVLLFVTMALQAGQAPVVVGELIEQLRANDIEVNINEETGAVSFRESILFDEGSATLKPSGKTFLSDFTPVYSSVLFSKEEFREEITRVVVEGHTSSGGSYGFNMDLSAERAMSVAQYILSGDLDIPKQDVLREKLLVAGRGETEARQDVDDPSDRRVILRLAFRGDDIRMFFRDFGGAN